MSQCTQDVRLATLTVTVLQLAAARHNRQTVMIADNLLAHLGMRAESHPRHDESTPQIQFYHNQSNSSSRGL
jgi:hypothetical protein